METRLWGTSGGILQHNIDGEYKFNAEIYYEKEDFHYDLCLNAAMAKPLTSMYHFCDAIANNRPHIATGEEGLLVMKLLDSLYLSASTGEPVSLVR